MHETKAFSFFLFIGTFFPPEVTEDELLAYRNPPDAWGDYNLSAGWVSELDLYRYRLGETADDSNNYFEDLNFKNDYENENDILVPNSAAASVNLLGQLSKEVMAAMTDSSSAMAGSADGDIPKFSSGTSLDNTTNPLLTIGKGCLQVLYVLFHTYGIICVIMKMYCVTIELLV